MKSNLLMITVLAMVSSAAFGRIASDKRISPLILVERTFQLKAKKEACLASIQVGPLSQYGGNRMVYCEVALLAQPTDLIVPASTLNYSIQLPNSFVVSANVSAQKMTLSIFYSGMSAYSEEQVRQLAREDISKAFDLWNIPQDLILQVMTTSQLSK